MTTKIHALVEALGNLARWRLTPGQAADVSEAEPLLEGVAAKAVAADKAYDSQSLVDTITASGASPRPGCTRERDEEPVPLTPR